MENKKAAEINIQSTLECVKLIEKAKTQEEKKIYMKTWSSILQKKQKEVIAKGIF